MLGARGWERHLQGPASQAWLGSGNLLARHMVGRSSLVGLNIPQVWLAQGRILPVSLNRSVDLGRSPDLLEPWFAHLQTKGDNLHATALLESHRNRQCVLSPAPGPWPRPHFFSSLPLSAACCELNHAPQELKEAPTSSTLFGIAQGRHGQAKMDVPGFRWPSIQRLAGPYKGRGSGRHTQESRPHEDRGGDGGHSGIPSFCRPGVASPHSTRGHQPRATRSSILLLMGICRDSLGNHQPSCIPYTQDLLE